MRVLLTFASLRYLNMLKLKVLVMVLPQKSWYHYDLKKANLAINLRYLLFQNGTFKILQ